MSRCDSIAEALVMGEPLSADDQAHVDSCAACQRLTKLPALLAASASAEPPRPGFSARMMASARECIAQRQRRRFVGFTLALAAAGASAVVVDRRLVREPSHVIVEPPDGGRLEIEPELRLQLREFTSFDRAMAPVARWDDIEAPVHNYGALLGGHP